jgi:hypothetical protein
MACVIQYLHVWKSADPESLVILKEPEFHDAHLSKIVVNPLDPFEFVSHADRYHGCVWKLVEPLPLKEVTNKHPADLNQAHRVCKRTFKSQGTSHV